ncbi:MULTISPECIES: rRNA adenine N-6-methyltransferase family protein [Bacillaceae]|uniref:rRNA adenine N-6-methyltransferase family protein n=1 Tax=Bacillaceae TaxID=186817 RepID=UPI001A8F04C1|nr:rRNA adenine N-6-methyltransferase family protein [Bacillus sp. NTK034]MBN8201202.1 hypothetical protein [Bacillus sp. NTK034]
MEDKYKNILEFWRNNLYLPNSLTREETMRFWLLEAKPYKIRPETVKKYQKKNNIQVLIETGTYKGAMIEAVLNNFNKIVSIELDKDLYNEAKIKFSSQSHVNIVHGDSSLVLGDMLKSINVPCVFWLDGHYVPDSIDTARGDRDTPILDELDQILKHHVRHHVILIDDARCFIGPNPILNDYPTIQELKKFVKSRRPELSFQVADDIIRILP